MKKAAKKPKPARVKIAGLTVTKGAKPTPAFWRNMFKLLSEETEPKVRPSVEGDIEADMSGNGSNAFARRVGLAYLTKPFRESARGMGKDRETAEMWLDLAKRVEESAEAHRKVADLLAMANTRIFAALSAVAANVESAKSREARRAA